MPDYRRNRVPGGTFFFTVNLLDRSSDLFALDEIRLMRGEIAFQVDCAHRFNPNSQCRVAYSDSIQR
jgi:REP-associated tyrosine transposase